MLSILISLAVSSFVGALVIIAFLALKKLLNWIREKGQVANKDEVAFILKEKLANGHYKVVEGIFNQKKENITEAEQFEAEEIDSDLKIQDNLVIYS